MSILTDEEKQSFRNECSALNAVRNAVRQENKASTSEADWQEFYRKFVFTVLLRIRNDDHRHHNSVASEFWIVTHVLREMHSGLMKSMMKFLEHVTIISEVYDVNWKYVTKRRELCSKYMDDNVIDVDTTTITGLNDDNEEYEGFMVERVDHGSLRKSWVQIREFADRYEEWIILKHIFAHKYTSERKVIYKHDLFRKDL